MSTGAPGKTGFTTTLAFNSVVRIKALPEITLTLLPFATHALTTPASPLDVRGRVSNLKDAIGCVLRWVFATGGQSRTVPHPVNTSVTPDSTTGRLSQIGFAVTEKPTGHVPRFDVLALGLYGKGQLGCEIELDLPGRPTASLLPTSSTLEIDATAELEPLDADGRPLGPGARVLVGSKVQARPNFARMFNGKNIRVELQEAGQGFADEKGTTHPNEWTLGATNDPWALQVGCLTVGASPRFDFRARDKSALEYRYTIYFLQGGSPQPNATPIRGVLLAAVPKPRLESFELALEDKSRGAGPGDATQVLAAHGKFSGFDSKLEFAVELTLYCRYVVDGSIRHEQVADLGDSAAIQSSKHVVAIVSNNEFTSELLELGPADDPVRARLARGDEFAFFAVVRLPPTVASRPEKVKDPSRPALAVFADLIDYAANEGEPGQLGHSCPFGERYARAKNSATGVCSNTVDVRGARGDLGYERGLRFTPNSDAVKAFKASTQGKALFAALKRPFAEELASASSAQREALTRLASRFQNRIELYETVSAITGVPAEMIAALHANDGAAPAAPATRESGFGINPTLHSDASCNSVLQRFAADVVGSLFTRGKPNQVADIFQAAVVAAEILRGDANACGASLPDGRFQTADLSDWQIAAMIAAYVSGPSDKSARAGLSTGANYLFSTTDADPRVFIAPLRRDSLTRWDVLLPVLQDWLVT